MNVFIHIGTGKTGTSYIQSSFVAHQKTLIERHGLLYPESGRVHHRHRVLRQIAERTSPATAFLDQLEQECGANRASTILLSDENLSWLNRYQIQTLRDAFGDHRPRIILWLRNQADMIRSAWQEAVKHGEYESLSSYIRGARGRPRLEYLRMADQWAEGFGKEAMRIVLFDELAALGQDFFSAMLGVVGIADDSLKGTRDRNAAESAPVTYLQHVSNQHLRQMGVRDPDTLHRVSAHIRRSLQTATSALPVGGRHPVRLATDDVAWIRNHCADFNATLCARYAQSLTPPNGSLLTHRKSAGHPVHSPERAASMEIAGRALAILGRDLNALRDGPAHITEPLMEMVPASALDQHAPLVRTDPNLWPVFFMFFQGAGEPLLDLIRSILKPEDIVDLRCEDGEGGMVHFGDPSADALCKRKGLLTVIEEPAMRLARLYSQAQRDPDSPWHDVARRYTTPLDFLEATEVRGEVENPQTRRLAYAASISRPRGFGRADAIELLDQAKSALESSWFVGLTARWPESARLLGYSFSFEVPPAQATAEPVAMDPEFAQLARKKNPLDTALYRFADDLLDLRLTMMKDGR